MGKKGDTESKLKYQQEKFVVYLELIATQLLQVSTSVPVKELARCIPFERAAPELWCGQQLGFRKTFSEKVKKLAEIIDKYLYIDMKQKRQEILQICDYKTLSDSLPWGPGEIYDDTPLDLLKKHFHEPRACRILAVKYHLCYNLKKSVETIEQAGKQLQSWEDQFQKAESTIDTLELLYKILHGEEPPAKHKQCGEFNVEKAVAKLKSSAGEGNSHTSQGARS